MAIRSAHVSSRFDDSPQADSRDAIVGGRYDVTDEVGAKASLFVKREFREHRRCEHRRISGVLFKTERGILEFRVFFF